MFEALGLTRDPFGPSWDADLYWEGPERAAARSAARGALAGGQGVWLRGEAGSGRETLAVRVAADVARTGVPVLVPDRTPTVPEAVLGAFLEASGTPAPAGTDLLDRAAGLYERILDAFAGRGPVVFVAGGDALSGPALGEVAALAGLRLAGQRVAVPLLWGEGDPPWPDLAVVDVAPLSAGDLRALVAHRLAAAGRPDLLGPAALGRLVEDCAGPADAVAAGRRHLMGLLFAGDTTAPSDGTDGPGGTPVLDPDALDEAGVLLAGCGKTPSVGFSATASRGRPRRGRSNHSVFQTS